MAAINDGGQAFPRAGYSYEHPNHGLQVIDPLDGMSLRDWFAGQALTGILANNVRSWSQSTSQAEAAFQIADAMISQRDVVNAEFAVNKDVGRLSLVAYWMLQDLERLGRRGGLIEEAKAILAKFRPPGTVNLD